MLFIDVVLFGAAIYMLALTIKMKNTRTIPSFFVNGKINLEKAHDTEGYINCMVPKLIVFCSVLIVFSGINMLSNVIPLPSYIVSVSSIVYFVLIIIYAVISVKAQNKYLF